MESCSASRSYQWLFFDADGTLFDFEKAQGLALEQVFRHHQLPYEPSVLERFRQINAELWPAYEQRRLTLDALKVRRFELLLAAAGAAHDPEPFAHVYLQYLGECPELLDGAEALLRTLRAKYQIAILTNGLRTVQRSRFARSAIREFVSQVVISEEIGFAKPAREYFDAAFALVGNPAKDAVLMIGDSWSSDIQGAAAYGVDTCWFNPSRQPRPSAPVITHEVATLQELPHWLGLSTLDAPHIPR